MGCRGPGLWACGGGCCSGDPPLAGARSWQLQRARGAAMRWPSSRGPWTPVGGCGCWHRVQRWLGTCPGPGGKRVLRCQGRRRRFCPIPVPSHSPAGAVPRCRVYPDCAHSSPRCVLRGTGTSQPFPGYPPPTWLAAGREQDADGSAGRRRWAGDVVLGWLPRQGCICGPVGKVRDISAGKGRVAELGWQLVVRGAPVRRTLVCSVPVFLTLPRRV